VRLGDILRSKVKVEEGSVGKHSSIAWKEHVQSLPINQIRPNPFQPRREFDEEQLAELAASIREHGVLHPVVVRRKENGYELVVGERRLRACQSLQWESIPAIVREMTDSEVAEIAVIENIQREGLSFFEEAESYRRLIDEFGLTQDELAERLGKSQSAIANKLRLLRFSPEIRARISREMLSERHARALLRLKDDAEIERALDAVIAQGMNVRQTEEWITKRLSPDEGQGKKRKTQSVKGVYGDYRLLLNSVRKMAEQMKSGGARIEVFEEDGDEFVEIRIRVHQALEKGGR